MMCSPGKSPYVHIVPDIANIAMCCLVGPHPLKVRFMFLRVLASHMLTMNHSREG
jgi:hypothetical protein